jgi:hypothetical protein
LLEKSRDYSYVNKLYSPAVKFISLSLDAVHKMGSKNLFVFVTERGGVPNPYSKLISSHKMGIFHRSRECHGKSEVNYEG